MTVDGQITNRYPVPTANAGVLLVAVGPDGNIWFSEDAGDKISRLDRRGATPSVTVVEPTRVLVLQPTLQSMPIACQSGTLAHSAIKVSTTYRMASGRVWVSVKKWPLMPC